MLNWFFFYPIIIKLKFCKIGAWRRWLAHQHGGLEVARSNRVAPTIVNKMHIMFTKFAYTLYLLYLFLADNWVSSRKNLYFFRIKWSLRALFISKENIFSSP